MLSPREQQSWWARVKTPAAVSLACLAATLLIAAQGFRGIPHHRSNNLASSRSSQVEKIYTLDPADNLLTSKEVSSHTTVLRGSIETETQLQIKNALYQLDHPTGVQDLASKHGDHPTGVKDLATGPHKEKGPLQTSQLVIEDKFSNVTAIREVLYGMEVLVINKTLSGKTPQAVLLLFHGCSHSATDWWYPSSNCTSCTGLPEEVAITKAAMKRDFAVVAFSSMNRDVHKCWDTTYPPEKSVDVPIVLKVWQHLLDQEGWGRIPHFALGGSSGGAFLLHLAQRLPLDGINPVIMSVPSQNLDSKPRLLDSSKSWTFPPTFFVSMERDPVTLDGVASNAATLKKQGALVSEVVVRQRNLSATFFSDRIESIDNTTSAAMYKALLAEGCLNSTGFLVENPRSLLMEKKWQSALRERVPETRNMNFNSDESPVFEELNLAWAGHELTSDHIDEVLDWFIAKQDGPKLMSAVNPRLTRI